MKVLIIMQFPLFGAGTGTYVRKLSEKLAKLPNFEVAVAAPDNRTIPGVKLYTIKPPFRAVMVTHSEWKNAKRFTDLNTEEFTRYYSSYLKQIVDIVDKFKPDVIHVQHCFILTWIANYIKSIFGVCYIATSHGTCVYLSSLDFRFRALTSQALQRATEITAVSHHTKKWFCKIFGQDLRRKVKVITGGIDLKAYNRNITTSEVEKKYNLQGKDIVIYVGRLTKEKGVEYLIKAAPKIKAEVFIIGGGSHKNFLMNYAKLIGAKNIHFLGYIDKGSIGEIRQFYKRAKVCVVPSVWDEPLGLVILEVMAMETPVVASRKGGIPLAVKDGYNGILIRPRSANAILVAVNKLLGDEKMRLEMGKNARKSVEERFDWENAIVPKFVPLYRKVAECTKNLRDKKIKQLFEKEQIEREKRELSEKLGAI